MALIKCKECGHEISQKATSCPKCGAPLPKRTSVVTWIVAGVLGLLLLNGILRSGSTPPSEQASTEVAAARPPAPPKQIYRTTALELFADYQANEVATDEKLKGKIVEVRGTVESIDKDFTDSIVVRLHTSNRFMSANMHANDSEKHKVMSLKKEDAVTFRCQKMTRVMGSPSGTDCELVTSRGQSS